MLYLSWPRASVYGFLVVVEVAYQLSEYHDASLELITCFFQYRTHCLCEYKLLIFFVRTAQAFTNCFKSSRASSVQAQFFFR